MNEAGSYGDLRLSRLSEPGSGRAGYQPVTSG